MRYYVEQTSVKQHTVVLNGFIALLFVFHFLEEFMQIDEPEILESKQGNSCFCIIIVN